MNLHFIWTIGTLEKLGKTKLFTWKYVLGLSMLSIAEQNKLRIVICVETYEMDVLVDGQK